MSIVTGWANLYLRVAPWSVRSGRLGLLVLVAVVTVAQAVLILRKGK